MTRYRVPFCGLTVLAVAVSAAFDANAQTEKRSQRARMLNSNGSVIYSYCDSYTLSAASDGSLEVNCTTAAVVPSVTPGSTPPPTAAPTEKGVLGFSSDTIPQKRPNEPIPVTIRRFGVSGGAPYFEATTLLDVGSGPCTPGRQSVTLGALEQEKTINLTAAQIGRCGIRVVTGDAASTGFTSVFVDIAGTPMDPPVATPPPTSTPAPTPPPTVAAGTCGANLVMQPLLLGGTNNYVFDSAKYINTGRPNIDPGVTSPQGTIQVFELPKIAGGQFNFASYIYYSAQGMKIEVSLSKCKGDFETYKTQQVTEFGGKTYTPCGFVSDLVDFNMGWAVNAGAYNACNITPNETWYLNWRVVPGTCPTNSGHTCGATFTS